MTFAVSKLLLGATATASVGGVLFGYDIGVVSGALPSLQASLDLSPSQLEMVVSFLYLGCIFGAIVGGEASDRLGRRTVILVTDGVFLAGALLLAAAPGLGAILLGRIVVGVAVAVSAVANVSYLTEIGGAEKHHPHRGSLVSCYEACIGFGFLVAYVVSCLVTLIYRDGWRLMFGFSGIIALAQFVGMLRCPESPVWLANHGRENESQAVSQLFNNGKNESDDQVEEMELVNRGAAEASDNSVEQNPRKTNDPNNSEEVSESTIDPPWIHYWRQGVIAIFLAVAEQLCGHINILSFAPELLSQVFATIKDGKEYEPDPSSLLATTVILGTVKFVITVYVIFEVEHLGRRFLLLGGVAVITISLLLLVFSFSPKFEAQEWPTDDVDNPIFYVHTKAQRVLGLLGCSGVVCGYAFSYGPLTWLLTSELFPASIRGRALGLSTVLTYACAALVSHTFLSGQERHGLAAPFSLYFFISLCSCLFIYVAIPDTGGVEVEEGGKEVDVVLDKMWLWQWLASCRCWCCNSRQSAMSSSRKELEQVGSCFDEVERTSAIT